MSEALAKKPGRFSRSAPQVRALEHSVRLLELLSKQARPQNISDLARSIGVHTSTAHRVLAILEAYGLVEREEMTGKVMLGLQIYGWAQSAIQQKNLGERARRHIEDLSSNVDETVELSVARIPLVVCVAKAEPVRNVRATSWTGKTAALHCTAAGKVMLAFRGRSTFDEYVRTSGLQPYTDRTIIEPAALLAEMERTRERGYAVEQGEMESDLAAVAAPIVGTDGTAAAVVSILAPISRLPVSRVGTLATAAIATADEIARDLGYRSSRLGRFEPL